MKLNDQIHYMAPLNQGKIYKYRLNMRFLDPWAGMEVFRSK